MCDGLAFEASGVIFAITGPKTFKYPDIPDRSLVPTVYLNKRPFQAIDEHQTRKSVEAKGLSLC